LACAYNAERSDSGRAKVADHTDAAWDDSFDRLAAPRHMIATATE